MNLVAPSTLGEVWERHIGDSLELEARFLPSRGAPTSAPAAASRGSSSAICRNDARLDLIESSAKKCAFLRAAMRETGVNGGVQPRGSRRAARSSPAAEIVTARALAPLAELLGFVAPHLAPGYALLLPEGPQS